MFWKITILFTSLVATVYIATEDVKRKVWHLILPKLYNFKKSIYNSVNKIIYRIQKFLPSCDVIHCFAFDLVAIQPSGQRVTKYINYLVDTYISEDNTFPATIWTSLTADSNWATNACKSFHSYLNKSFSNSHFHIFGFIETIFQYQLNVYIKMKSTNCAKLLNNETSSKTDLLNHCISAYKTNTENRLSFVKQICNYFGGTVHTKKIQMY